MKLRLQSAQDTPAGPARIAMPRRLFQPYQSLVVSNDAGKTIGYGQAMFQGQVALLLPAMCAGKPLVVDVAPGSAEMASPVGVSQEPHKITITLAGQPFGVFRYEPDRAKPIVWPLVGPDGIGLTRDWPVNQEDGTDSRDHIHHQSFWVAHGDVNGVDFWTIEKGHGTQQVRDLKLTKGPACVTISARIDWVSAQCVTQMTEQRELVFWNQVNGLRFVDLLSRFEMSEGDVRFGDTKEGGMCSIRVAPAMEEQRKGGLITNGNGAQGEEATWGKPAPWCDYSGTLAGKAVGIAILDHPANFRHPVPWHVRAYGLMTANPFGISYFTNDKAQDGSYTWQKGDVVEYRYRVILHSGDAAAAGIDSQWNLFANGPSAEVL